MFTTWGPVRGCCGHAHTKLSSAIDCLEADRKNRESDRYVYKVNTRRDIWDEPPGKRLGFDDWYSAPSNRA